MLKLENISTMNWGNAMRGARNPMNSWEKGDSHYNEFGSFILGPNDLSLATRLCKAGTDHRKFIRQIMVSMDITAPLYWWKEFDTYKVGTVANSCSTMHKIQAKEFTFSDFSCEHLFRGDEQEATLSFVGCNKVDWTSTDVLNLIIKALNANREAFLKTKDKAYWWQMIQLLPSSYNQMRTVSFNYEVLANIYFARKDHKLQEWHTLCDAIEKLPYFKEFFELD